MTFISTGVKCCVTNPIDDGGGKLTTAHKAQGYELELSQVCPLIGLSVLITLTILLSYYLGAGKKTRQGRRERKKLAEIFYDASTDHAPSLLRMSQILCPECSSVFPSQLTGSG